MWQESGEDEKYKILVEKGTALKKWPYMWKHNIIMDVREWRWEGVDFFHLTGVKEMWFLNFRRWKHIIAVKSCICRQFHVSVTLTL